MLDLLTLGAEMPQRSIRLDTRRGNPIDNFQVFEISANERNRFYVYHSGAYGTLNMRSGPSPEYNCHGLSFASRRTSISEPDQVRAILKDDEYYKIEMIQVKPCDIVLYIDTENGDIMHSGIVVEATHEFGNLSLIIVVSKWGRYAEVIHQMNNCPYNTNRKEFYRLDHKQYGHGGLAYANS